MSIDSFIEWAFQLFHTPEAWILLPVTVIIVTIHSIWSSRVRAALYAPPEVRDEIFILFIF